MVKKLKYIFFIFLFFFIFMMPVKADDCGIIGNKIDEYYTYDDELQKTDCTKNDDENIVKKCNELNMKKNTIVTYLMNQRGLNKVCDSQLDAVNSIISENEDKCGKVLDDEFDEFINSLLAVFYIIAPILLIVFGSLDYTKAIVSNDAASLKKANKTFLKRILATILLFLTPMITNFIIKLAGSSYTLEGSIYACDYEYILHNKKVSIAVGNSSSGVNNNSSAITQMGQTIAEKAKEIKEYIASHGYTYNATYVTADLVATDSQKQRNVVCATLVAASLYRANIYDVSKLNYGINSAPSTAKFLRDNGWTLIENVNDLQPGDILFYEKLVDSYTATAVEINGEKIHTCHTDIYYGDGKKINTGGDLDKVLTNFYADTSCYSVKSKFRYAFRYPGKG